MIRLDFKVDRPYLIYWLLSNTSPSRFIPGVPRDAVVAFQNLAWEHDRDAYNFLRGNGSGIQSLVLAHQSLADIGRRADELLEKMSEQPVFTKLEQETLRALENVRAEWDSDYSESIAAMEEMTGLSFDSQFEVLITHPAQKNGHGGRQIGWTYRNDFPHYNTVYLWHEIMHTYLPTNSHHFVVNCEHAVIELLTDNELRVRFNGGAYPPLAGHAELNSLKEKLLPSWQDYLKQPDKNIHTYHSAANSLLADHG